MNNATLISRMNFNATQQIKKANNNGLLGLNFNVPGKKEPIQIGINVKITKMNLLKQGEKGLYQLSLNFKTKPPDDYIVILGKILEAKSYAQKDYIEEPDENSVKIKQDKHKLKCVDTEIINGENREKCVLDTVSVSAARVIIKGERHEFLDKKVRLIMSTEEIEDSGEADGIVTRCSDMKTIDGSVTIINISFESGSVPDEFKNWVSKLSGYLAG
jgi:hypothetical protein